MIEKHMIKDPQDESRSKGRPRKDGPKVGVETVINSARALMRQHRPAQISRAEIARLAGVDQKLIRYYFENYEDLLHLALDIDLAGLEETMTVASRPQKSATQVLRNRVNALVTFLVKNPTVFKTLVERVYTGETARARERLEKMTDGAYDRHLGMVKQGWETGEFRPDFDPRFLYLAIIGMAEFFNTGKPVVEHLFGTDSEKVRSRYQRFIVGLVLHGISSMSREVSQNSEGNVHESAD